MADVAGPQRLELDALEWLPASADRATALTTEPRACLVVPASAEIADEVELGEIIFNSPALLGGQAEKMGLSCGSCHRNGRGNRDFQFEAISGAPGTADVTSGLFSTVRADNQFNPVPIPDLAAKDGRDQVDRTDRAALAGFVRGQIEDEFSGARPPDEVFAPLLTYLQAIDGRGSDCLNAPDKAISWRDDWADARLAVSQIEGAEREALQAFYIRTARLSLGRIHARYHAADHADIRIELVALSRALGAGDPWPEDTSALEGRLTEGEGGSLYDAEVLAAALGGQAEVPSTKADAN